MKRALLLVVGGFTVLLLAMTAPAYAQATRTWVSGVGDDANPCSRTAPCKTFAGAIAQTAAGGEIDALDPGGFGALTITKSITIDGGGGQVASVLVAGTPGLVINAASTDVITIKNMRLQGMAESVSPGLNGINFVSGAVLNIENCVIQNFGVGGINIAPASNATVNIVHSIIEGNFGGGVIASPQNSAQVGVSIDSSEILNNTNGPSGTGAGVVANAGARVSVSNSNISGNRAGLVANGASTMLASDSRIVNNWGIGIHAVSSGVIGVYGSSIYGNLLYGILAETGGAVQSYGNNALFGNNTNGTFSAPNLVPALRLRHP